MLALKDYQQRALDELHDYLALCGEMGAKNAFISRTDHAYHQVEQLPGMPYVCIRIPTGGGKTLVACHGIGVVSQTLLRQENTLVLWLVPTNTIKDQTLNALRDRNHPYRQAVESVTQGRVTVMDIREALCVQRHTLDSDTVVIVSTLAAWRVDDTEGRKVYDQNGALLSHFTSCPSEISAKLDKYPDTDTPIPSLANVLKMRHPVVIVDEAHNARTSLSFETLARFDPSCIVEFTATPATSGSSPSNVLYHISAFELKAEDMIKLPIRLQANSDWKETVAAAIAKRTELEVAANAERADGGSYLRPIVLLQAQPQNQRGDTLDVTKMCSCLLDAGVPNEQIAVETGQVNDVGKWERENRASLFDESCPIRFIVTVDKLREGWDCPFAYVLCSVREMGAARAIEQVLGRVLRMPNAARKSREELNVAYAFVSSARFDEAAKGLAEALVTGGFTRLEADWGMQAVQETLPEFGGLFAQSAPKLAPAQRGERLAVPQLCLWVDGELEPIEETHFLQKQWNLADCDPSLSETEFPTQAKPSEQYDVDVNKRGDASIRLARDEFVSDLQLRLAMLVRPDIASPDQLAIWLDRHIPHPDIPQPQSILFLRRMVTRLTEERSITLEQLVHERLRLRDAAARKIAAHRAAVVKTAYQQILFGDFSAKVEVDAKRVFEYDLIDYPVSAPYSGPRVFDRHYYPLVGAMNGEEADCAGVIDSLPQVRYWVRNLERRPEHAFWLQTSTDKFYPDFVALLEDGLILAVEYKGQMIADTEDTREKRLLGALWEAKSNGACIFQLVTRDDYESAIRNAVAD